MSLTNPTEPGFRRVNEEVVPGKSKGTKPHYFEIPILSLGGTRKSGAVPERRTGFQKRLAVVLLLAMLVICGRAAVEHPIRTVVPFTGALLASIALGLKWATKALGQIESAALGSRVGTDANTENLARLPLKNCISVVRVRKAQADWTSVGGQFHFDGHDAA